MSTGKGRPDGELSLEDPLLLEVASAAEDHGLAALVIDPRWRIVHQTSDHRRLFGAHPVGVVYASTEWFAARLEAPFERFTVEQVRNVFSQLGGLMLHEVGGREELRSLVDPRLHDLVDQLDPLEAEVRSFTSQVQGVSRRMVEVSMLTTRVRHPDGRRAGMLWSQKPNVGMSTLAALVGNSNVDHLERMMDVTVAARRPAAILFADLQGSSPLSRRLPTASYFTLARRLVRAADHCIIEAGGMVGRHVGDGVTAFFLAESVGSESAAARASISAARALRAAVTEVAARSDLPPEEVQVRIGLHWGSTLYVGNITTEGRSEVIDEGDPDLVVLDVRTPEEFAEAHLADAILIDIYEPDFADRIAELDRSVPYVLYCRSGNRSEEARNLMAELGFEEVYDVAGGIVGWTEAGLSVVT